MCLIFSIISFVFLPACVTRQYQDYEIYYETEYRTEYKTETYITTEEVVTTKDQGKEALIPEVRWFNSAVSIEPGKPVYYYGYILPPAKHSKMEVRISIEHNQSGSVRVYYGGGSIPINPTALYWYYPHSPIDPLWLDSLNSWLGTAKLLGAVSLDDETKDSITFNATDVPDFAVFVNSWDSKAISKVVLTWSDQVVTKRDVTKERQVPVSVPYQVEKKRPVTREKEVPVWELLLSGPDSNSK